MKKWLCVLLAAMMAASAVPAFGEEVFFEDEEDFGTGAAEDSLSSEESFSEEEEDEGFWVEYDFDELTVANPTHLDGCFYSDLWGNATSDIDVRRLVTGYNLIKWDGDLSVFRFDHSVVSGTVIGDDQEGNRRYLISLCDDLSYSDATPITARDYAFSVLLQTSPLIEKLGGTPARLDWLAGYEAYAAGETDTLAGLRVIDDYQLVFIVKKEALPYFYELGRFDFAPSPIHVIAPGCAVRDDGQGAYIGSEDPQAEAPLFTEALLRETILAPGTGYLVHPVPGSGPYSIQTFDGETASFTLNPWYKGDEEGTKPKIRSLIYTWAHNENMVAGLGEGEYALLNKVTLSEAIQRGLELCATQGQFTRSTYPRTGLTYFYFVPDSAPAQSEKVRKALAYAFNKEQFITDYVGYYGLEADGLYGLGQWMYQLVSGTMMYPVTEPENPTEAEQKAYEDALAEWEQISLSGLTRYPFDAERAAALLDEDGWSLNEQGEPFEMGKDSLRYKKTADGLAPLTLKVAYTEDDGLLKPLTQYFAEPLNGIGVQTELISASIEELNQVFDGTKTAAWDLIYLGNNFSAVFDPSAIFRAGKTAGSHEGAPDSIPSVYAELYGLAKEMDRTEPTDVLGYMKKWVAFQERLSETLPILPVYINVYFDFYTRELHDYWIADYPTWADAAARARMYEAESASPEELNELFTEYQLAASGTRAASAADFKTTHREKTEPASGGALSTFPKEVQEQVPAEYRVINEFVTASLSDSYQNVKSSLLQFAFETRYPAGETVYLLFGIPQKNSVRWMVKEGRVQKNGSVCVTLEKSELDQLAGKEFPLAAVSKK